MIVLINQLEFWPNMYYSEYDFLTDWLDVCEWLNPA